MRRSKDSIVEAIWSPYCYELACIWEGQGELISWILLHPRQPVLRQQNAANQHCIEDRTIKRMKHWTQAASNMFKVRFGGFIAVFLFSRYMQDSSIIASSQSSGVDVVGCKTNTYIREAIRHGVVTVGAWGASAPMSALLPRLRMIESWRAQCGKQPLYCIGSTPSGYPLAPDDRSLKRSSTLKLLAPGSGDLDVWD